MIRIMLLSIELAYSGMWNKRRAIWSSNQIDFQAILFVFRRRRSEMLSQCA